MKNILPFILFSFIFSSLNAQFSTDIMVKQSATESYSDPDAVASINGNLFVTYLVDAAGTKGCEIAMSTNSGISWEVMYRWFNPSVMVNKAVITSSGTGASERVIVLMTSQENISFTSSLDIFYFTPSNGNYLTSVNIETGVVSKHTQIDIESDSKSNTGSAGIYAFMVAYSGDIADSIGYFSVNGPGFYRKHVANTGPGQLGHVHINHAINDNFTNGLFMMAWDDTYGSNRVFMATTGTSPMPVGPIATMRVDDDAAANQGRIHKPYVVTQNNNGAPPSGTASYGLLHGIFYFRDSTDLSSTDVLGDVNKEYSTFTSFADHCLPEPTTQHVGDYAAVNYNNEAHIVYYNTANQYLNWRSNTSFLNSPTSSFTEESAPGGRINDVPSITFHPDPVIILSTTYNQPAFFWVDEMSGKGTIKYDAPYMGGFASLENISMQAIHIFPNPVAGDQKMVNIQLPDFSTSPVSVELIHINGQVCQAFTLQASGSFSFRLNDEIVPGIYCTRIFFDGKQAVSKLIVQ